MKNIEKNTWHRFIFVGCALVTLIIAVVWLPAASADEEGVLTYTLNGTEVTITRCAQDATSEQVVEAFDEICSQSAITITSISDYAFSNCWKLTSVTIPDSVTSIGDGAFYSCTALKSVIIPGSVASIGKITFYDCKSLTNIEIQNGVTSIGNQAFSYCEMLTDITIPDSVTSIGNEAFRGCKNLTNVTIPDSVTNIGDGAFVRCYGLTNITISAGVTSISDGAFYFCYGLTSVNIPDSVTRIGNGAFYFCYRLTSVNIPDSVTSIGDGAFYGCSDLTSVNIPDSVTSIGNRAFCGCSDLTSINIPDSVTSIGNQAFSRCSNLTSVNIPAGVTSIGDGAFSYCRNLTSATISAGVTSIGNEMFFQCESLTSIDIPASVKTIGDYAFYGCYALTEIAVDPSNASFISDSTGALIDGAQILIKFPVDYEGSYTIPPGVTGISDGAFYGCSSLTNINIPAGVTSIGEEAFYGCSSLTSINIPAGVTSIGGGAFYGCYALTEIAVDPLNTFFENDTAGALIDSTQAELIKFPVDYEGSYTIPPGLTGISEEAFYGCKNITNIVIPNGITSISYDAFNGCSSLTSINIPGSVTDIGNSTFYRHSSTTNATIPSYDDPTSPTLPGGSAGGGSSVFFNCIALSEITIEPGMTELPIYVLTENIFKDYLELYVPTSVMSVSGGTPPNLNKKLLIHGLKDSFIQTWAETNNIPFEKIDGTITEMDADDAWLKVPYQYIIETNMPNNVNLKFEIVGGELPDGLELMQKGGIYEGLPLMSGQFHGAPLETGDFTIEVEVRADVGTWNYLLDRQAITLTVKSPNDADLARTNDYDVYDFVGEPAMPGIDGNYVLRGSRAIGGLSDQIFEVADSPEDDANGLSNFRYFVAFWIDGRELVRGPATDPNAEYDARDGSTIVTIYAKTFQALDNGEHTLAAEFMTRNPAGGEELDIQKVAAQKFTLELTNAPSDEGNPNPGSDTNPGTDTNPNPGQNTPGPSNVSGPSTGNASNAANESANAPIANQTPVATPAETNQASGTTPAESNTTGIQDNTTAAQEYTADANDAADDIAVPAPVTPPAPAGPDIAPAPQEIGGLLRDANGMYYFVLDGSGAPFEARIDIPLAEYEDMYFDGDLWTLGADYETREGSTILVITAEKLSGFAYGMHEISARFTGDRTVAFTFDLRGAQVPAAAESAGPTTPVESSVTAPQTPASRSPILPFVMLIFGAALLLSSTFTLRARRRAVN